MQNPGMHKGTPGRIGLKRCDHHRLEPGPYIRHRNWYFMGVFLRESGWNDKTKVFGPYRAIYYFGTMSRGGGRASLAPGFRILPLWGIWRPHAMVKD